MDLELRGKVAIVTGASKGIGLAVTKALVAEGVQVVAGARDVGGELAELARDGSVQPLSVDRDTARRQIVESQGGLATGVSRSRARWPIWSSCCPARVPATSRAVIS